MRRRRPAMNSVGSIGCRRSAFEQRFCDRTVARLGVHCAERLEELADRPLLAELKADPGQVGWRRCCARSTSSPQSAACGYRRICSPTRHSELPQARRRPAGRAIRLNVADQIATGYRPLRQVG
jgi:hypothetical protein